jgi:transposase
MRTTWLSAGAPAARRATRALRWRRRPLRRSRAKRLAHLHQPPRQDHRPELGKKLADKATRAGVAERFPEPAVQKSIEVDLALINSYDRLLTGLELDLVQTAKAHDAQTFCRLRSIPGVGKILTLMLLYEIHDIHRFPRVQEFVSYCGSSNAPKTPPANATGPPARRSVMRISNRLSPMPPSCSFAIIWRARSISLA